MLTLGNMFVLMLLAAGAAWLWHNHGLRERALERAFGFAEQVGVDPQSGAVCGMLAPDGSLRDGTQRIWAQAEYLRALTLRPDSQPRLLRQLLALQQRFLHASVVARSDIGLAQWVVYLHTAFNLLLAVVFIGLIEPCARLLTRLLPQPEPPADPGMPQYLDEAGLEVANVGLSNSVREALRLADMTSLMLNQVLQLFEKPDPHTVDKVRQLDHSIDLLSAAIRAYLADIGQDGLSDDDADRAQEVLMFVINLEHAGDILNNLAQLAVRRTRRGEHFSSFELIQIQSMHLALLDSLNLAVTAFLREDVSAAQALIGHKETVRKLKASASREHFRKLQNDKSAWAESGDIFQRVLRDYRRVHHHIAALGYPILERNAALTQAA